MRNNYTFLGGLVWGSILLIALVVSVPFVILSAFAEIFSVAK